MCEVLNVHFLVSKNTLELLVNLTGKKTKKHYILIIKRLKRQMTEESSILPLKNEMGLEPGTLGTSGMEVF